MKLIKRHVWIVIISLTAILVFWVMFQYREQLLHLFKILIAGIIIAYVLTPLCDFLERKLPRSAAIGLIIFVVAVLLAAFILFFIPRLVNEILALMDLFPSIMIYIRSILEKIQTRMETMGIPKEIQDSISVYIDSFQRKAADAAMKSLEGMAFSASALPTLFIALVIGFYFLRDREYFGEMLYKLIPLRYRRRVMPVVAEINHILHCFIRGEVFIAGAVGILATLGYFLLGLPYALILGFLAGILEFIPYFGPFLGAVPAVIIACLFGVKTFLWTLVLVIFIQQLEGILITPRILSGVVNLHPVYVILSLWTGGLLFGIPGMFLAVPAVLILRVIFKHIYLCIVGYSSY